MRRAQSHGASCPLRQLFAGTCPIDRFPDRVMYVCIPKSIHNLIRVLTHFTWRFPGTICLPSAWEEALKIASGNVDVLSCLRMVIRLKNRVPKELCISSCVAPQLIWSYKYRPWLWVEPKRVKRSLGWVIWKHVQIHGYELFIIIIPFLPSSHIAMQLFSHTSHRVALGSQQKISENDCCESSRPQTVTVQGHRVLVWVRD